MSFFESFGMDEINIHDYFEDWNLKHNHRIEDFLWHLFNTLLSENALQSKEITDFYNRNERIYNEMISFRRKIEKKPANEIHKIWNKNKLELTFESSNLEMDVIICASYDCEFKNEINNRIISFKEALKNAIIPYDNCKRKQGCVCCFVFQPKRDINGTLIRKDKN